MELRQLRFFVAVAETGNITRAAQKVFLTQPALSRQIQALEDEIGQCLLERSAHSIRLTPVGEALLPEARELLQRADEMLERVCAAARSVRLRVGYAPSLAGGLLADAVGIFAQKHPQAHVELFDLSTKELLAGLEDGTLDVAITVGRESDGYGLKWTSLQRASWQMAINHQHPLARRSEITPEEVAIEPLLVFCKRDYPEYWAIVTAWFREHRQKPIIAGEYDGVSSLMTAVASGLGVTIITSGAVQHASKNVRLIPLTTPPEPLRIAAAHRMSRASEKPIAVFIEELRHLAKTVARTDSSE